LDGRFTLITSEPILVELARTLKKLYFRSQLSAERIDAAFAALRLYARLVPLTVPVAGVAAHAQGDLIIATAVSAGAGFLVTGDRALQALGAYQGVAIVLPRAFLDTLDRAAGR